MGLELETDQMFTDEIAETITRYPNGSGAGVSVQAIVEIGPEEFDSVEAGWVRRGTVLVPATQTVNRTDTFLIRGTTHQVETVDVIGQGVKSFTFISSRRVMNR